MLIELCNKLIAHGFKVVAFNRPPFLLEVNRPDLDKPIIFSSVDEVNVFYLGVEAGRQNMLSREKVKNLQAAALEAASKPVCSCGCEDDNYYYYEAQLRAYANVLGEDYTRPEKVRRPSI